MVFKMLNIMVIILLLFIISGCASKEVVSFSSINKLNKEQTVVNEPNLDINKTSVENKVTTEIVPSDIIVSTLTDNKNQTIDVIDNMHNTTVSVINNENVMLKSIHFDYNIFTLTEENLIISAENATKIKNSSFKNNGFKIKLEGNCDEVGSDEYNYALGLKRADTVKKDLINKGIAADRIVVTSYGESNPLCKELTPECLTKNRRVDYSLVP